MKFHQDSYEIIFENCGDFLTVKNKGNVIVRCDSDLTDIADDEALPAFIERHGGAYHCSNYLAQVYGDHVRSQMGLHPSVKVQP